MNKYSFLLRPSLCVFFLGTSCADLGAPYPSQGGYYDPYYSGQRYDSDYHARREAERAREARREYEQERERLEEERRRLEEERRREAYTPPPPPQERCPAGFSQSDSKCSPQERKHGCQDIRMPGGLRCIRR